MSDILHERKYCKRCLTTYVLQSMMYCEKCESHEVDTFLVDDRFLDLRQFKANRNLKIFSELNALQNKD